MAAGEIPRLETLWLTLHHHHQTLAPELAPFVTDEDSWTARFSLYERALAAGGLAVEAVQDRHTIGYAVAAPLRRNWEMAFETAEQLTELISLVVLPTWRSMGVARRLLEAVDRHSAQRKVRDAIVGLLPQNRGAMRLYARRGFVPACMLLTRFQRARLSREDRGCVAVSAVSEADIDQLLPLWSSLHDTHAATTGGLLQLSGNDLAWAGARGQLRQAAADRQLWRVGSPSRPTGMIRLEVASADGLEDTWRTDPVIGRISSFVVRPECRRHGIGSQLLEFASRRFESMGIRDQIVAAAANSAAVFRLLEKFGFQQSWLEMIRPGHVDGRAANTAANGAESTLRGA